MPQFNPRDITWLGFNARVLQEAMDETVPLHLRIRFLGIFSNNFGASLRISSISPTFFIIDVKSEPIFFPAFTTLSKNFSSRIIGSVEHLNE